MKDKKLTDNEIKKALEGMIQFADMVNRSVLDMVDVQTLKNTLAYINRLQAKNESLKNAYKQCAWERDAYIEIENTAIAEAKAEAYTEFAERLRENSIATFSFKGVVMVEEIDNLLKEMVGGK